MLLSKEKTIERIKSKLENSNTILNQWKIKVSVELERNQYKNRNIVFIIERLLLAILLLIAIIYYSGIIETMI